MIRKLLSDEDYEYIRILRPYLLFLITIAIIVIIGYKFGDMSVDTVDGFVYSIIVETAIFWINVTWTDLYSIKKK